MSTSRARELWRHRASGEAYLVDLEEGRVASADGPLAPDELTPESLAMRRASQGRGQAYTMEAAELDRRRDEFDRERLEL
ncbi:MAG: hypothetical protein ICV74_03950 [Thermoleophilia bacterium]|nr:hypothetical protein [Thermoleophilia bacterium]